MAPPGTLRNRHPFKDDLRDALNLSITQLMKTASLKDARLDEHKVEGMKKKDRDLVLVAR